MTWLKQCRAWVERYDPVTPAMLTDWHHYGFVRRLSDALPDNAIIVSDTGGNVIMMGHAFRSKRGQRIFSSMGSTPMGFSMCGAIGAWFAQPERPIICLVGDGGFQLNSQELQTIKHYNVPVKIVILNNHILGNTRAWQIQNDKAAIACGPDGYSCPDFVAVVRAYGIAADGDFDHADTERLIAKFLATHGAAVWDVVHDQFCDYQPRMTLWQAGVEECFPLLPEVEFEANMTVQPLDGWRERRKQYKAMPDV